ncbi:pentatricopeptide repeat-containing protein At1g31790 [Solanum dulcamara]|uniref:pentatricopeptide repeat-containing protein At1g31790 n=1 Tax=Solanum dulcamara TaxID=45834 RepID=UPI002486BC04|nr:pentatricopeptide repeat-containing protein At1g31790 [Solanum dulcamara]
MEITSSYPKPPLLHTNISSRNSKKWIPITTHSINNTPLQFQLPLHRPQYKLKQPIKPEIKKTTNPTCTISDVLRLMDSLGLNIPVDIYVSLIKECTESRDPLKAIEIYEHICRSDVIPTLPLLNRLLLMLVVCGCFEHARQLFDKMRVRNSKSWAAIIAGCVENGEYEGALRLFMEMQSEAGNLCKCGDIIDDGILVCVLKACVELMNLEVGKQIHGWLLKLGNCESMALSSFLIKFYGEFGYLESADNVFDHVPHCNTVVWTARIGNLCKEEQFEGAIRIFREMVREGVKKNSFTFSSVLKACGKLSDAGCCGQQVHATSVKVGLDTDSYVQCSLINIYGKYGLLRDARSVLNTIEDKSNIACWNAMLMGCIQYGFGVEAMKLLYEMKEAGLQPHESLINEVLLVCGSSNIEKMNVF